MGVGKESVVEWEGRGGWVVRGGSSNGNDYEYDEDEGEGNDYGNDKVGGSRRRGRRMWKLE